MSDKPESVRMHRNPPGVISFKSFWQECDPSCFGTDSRVHWEHADFVPLAALEDAQGALRKAEEERDRLREALESMMREIDYLIEEGTLASPAINHPSYQTARAALQPPAVDAGERSE